MAMHFHEEHYLTCPSCGATTMTVEKVYRFSPDKREPAAVNGEYLHTLLRCSVCGKDCKHFSKAESIRFDR